MDHNQDRLTAFRENQARTSILSKEVQHLQEEKSKQVSTAPLLLRAGCLLPCLWTIAILFSSRPQSQG